MPARSRVTVQIRNDRTAAFIQKLKSNMKAAVDESAVNIEEFARAIAPVDTGALSESIYINNGTDSDYAQKAAFARNLNPDATIVDEVNPEFVISRSGGNLGKDSYTVVVGCSVDYAIFQEEGTINMRAQPFMRPAILGEESTLTQSMAKIANDQGAVPADITRVDQWIYTTFSTDVQLTSYVGTRIYADIAPQEPTTPLVIFSFLGGSDKFVTLNTRSTNAIYLIRVITQGSSYTPITVAADRIDALMRVPNQGVVSGNDTLITSVIREQPHQRKDLSNGIPYVYLGGFYRVRFQAFTI